MEPALTNEEKEDIGYIMERWDILKDVAFKDELDVHNFRKHLRAIKQLVTTRQEAREVIKLLR